MSAADVLDQQLRYLSIDPVFLEGLRKKYCSRPDDLEATFQYALGLSRSSDMDHLKLSKDLLKSLLVRAGAAKYSRDSAFYLAQCNYREGQFETARIYCEDLVRAYPDNCQIMTLHRAIVERDKEKQEQDRQAREDTITFGVIGAAGLALAIGLGNVLFGKPKK